MDRIDLTSKRIVITGGGGRLGAHMVEEFADRDADVVALVVSDAEARRVPQVSGGSVTIKRADLIVESSVVACFEEIGDEFGRIDALVHTVGMWSASPLLQTTQEDWDLMLQVNLTSTFLCFREAVRLIKSGPGTLVGISSQQGVDGGVAEQSAYSAAKAGVARLVESVAAEFGSRDIFAHAIAPSTIRFDGEGEGVHARDIVDLVAYLIVHGAALSGSTLRAYGV